MSRFSWQSSVALIWAKIPHYWQPQGELVQVRVAGTVQGSFDNDYLHCVKFSSLLIHFSLSKILKTTFFPIWMAKSI